MNIKVFITHHLNTKRLGKIGENLQDLNRKSGLTIIMVTHQPGLGRLGGRLIEMRNGQVFEN